MNRWGKEKGEGRKEKGISFSFAILYDHHRDAGFLVISSSRRSSVFRVALRCCSQLMLQRCCHGGGQSGGVGHDRPEYRHAQHSFISH